MRRDIQKILGIQKAAFPQKVIIVVLQILILLLGGVIGIAILPTVQYQNQLDNPPYLKAAIAILGIAIILKLILMRIQITNWIDYAKQLGLCQINFYLPYLFLSVFIAIGVKITQQINQTNITFTQFYQQISEVSGQGLGPPPAFPSPVGITALVTLFLQSLLVSLICCKKTITKLQVWIMIFCLTASICYYAIVQFFQIIDSFGELFSSFDQLKQSSQYPKLPENIQQTFGQIITIMEGLKDYLIAALAVLLGYYILAIDWIFRAMEAKQIEQKQEQLQEKLIQNTHQSHQSESHRVSLKPKDMQLTNI